MSIRHAILTGAAVLALAGLVVMPAWAAEEKGSEQKGSSIMQETKSAAKEAKGAVTDTWVTSKTKIALFADDRVKGRQIKVDTSKGVVTLRGKVDSEAAKSAAAEIAKGIEGVRSVKNDLQVVAPKEQKAVDSNDKDIAARVEQRLKKEPSLKAAKVSVRSDAGVVTLTGEAPSITVSARASELAREVPGVHAVRNELSLNPKLSSQR
ncbi:MAG TPA: BON domain-containing protein [Methylomirabilota bacterium]|nr:BON domain-containing protein [Methylomirabilota bacterium]